MDPRRPIDARSLIAEILRKNDFACADDAPLAELNGWDSLKGVRLVLRLQEVIGRELSEDEIATLQSVADVQRMLHGP
jgi:acyl carrier protein